MQYGEFRCGYGGDKEDTRIVFYGLRYLLETYLHVQWTREEVEKCDKFYRYQSLFAFLMLKYGYYYSLGTLGT